METKKKKLTVCDWCVLVVIFGMGASLLTPGISQAVEEKKLSDLVDRLQMIRSEILLYQTEHNGLLPGQRFANDIVTEQRFIEALGQQRLDGKRSYLRYLPDNPYVAAPEYAAKLKCVNDPNCRPTGSEGAAWWFNGSTGEFLAIDSAFHTNY
ncbi:MAG: hypothetical protein LLF76_09205 [Planctomycetaceae bacterium]|nr:hypothetical protein [Planctomycetaceae bacterium]